MPMKITDWIFLFGAAALSFLAGVTTGLTEGNTASGWIRHTIDASNAQEGKLGADGVRLADANGDGLLDVVTGWENGDAIRVCLHPGPEQAKSSWPGVTVGRVKGAEDAVFADLDLDGNLDVVSSTEGTTQTVFVHWAPENQDDYLDPDAWETEVVPALEGKQKWMYCLPFDANADGHVDLIFGSKGSGATVGWLERNPDDPRDLSAWRYHPLCEVGWIMSIRDVDLDGDGDQDVLFSDRKGSRTGIWWLENTGANSEAGGGVFAEAQRIGLAEEEVMFLDVSHLNDDNRLDVVAAVRPATIAFLYQPEGSEWKAQDSAWPRASQAGGVPQDRFGTSKAVRVADLDGDGALDLAVTCEHADGGLSGVFRVPYQAAKNPDPTRVLDISGPEGVKFDRIELLDLDGDGDLDLMTCEERDNLGVFWYENPAR